MFRADYLAGGTVAQNKLATSLTTGTSVNGCWVTVNGTDTLVQFCDLHTLMGVPDNDPRAPLYNQTPQNRDSLAGLFGSFVAKKLPGCVYPQSTTIDNDVGYLDASDQAKIKYAGMQITVGDMVDVQYRNGSTFRFTIYLAGPGQGWKLGDPTVTLKNNTACTK